MARPRKKELDYFAIDVHPSTKMRLIKAEFGLMGYAAVICLLQEIYGGEGYYCYWDEDSALLFANDWEIPFDLLKKVVQRAIERKIFDEGMYQQYGILTSREIQEFYFGAVKKRVVADDRAFLLIEEEKEEELSAAKTEVSADGNAINKTEENKTKEKENKKEEKEENEMASDLPSFSDPSSEKILPPTFGEIEEYCHEKGYVFVDKRRFFDHFAERNWQTSKGTPVDWKRRLGDWEAEDQKKFPRESWERVYTKEEEDARVRRAMEDMERLLIEDFADI